MVNKAITECDVSGDVFNGDNPEGMMEVAAKIPGYGGEVSGLNLHVKEDVLQSACVPNSAMEDTQPVVIMSGTYDIQREAKFGKAIGVMFKNSPGTRFDPYVITPDEHKNIEALCDKTERRLMEKGYEVKG